jgi:hypothetical protein
MLKFPVAVDMRNHMMRSQGESRYELRLVRSEGVVLTMTSNFRTLSPWWNHSFDEIQIQRYEAKDHRFIKLYIHFYKLKQYILAESLQVG